ncbi:MAG: TerB family tellurite resistance protein [Aliihoeflea sp.]|uniref:J domain-containing protein n=1 Tax=Aliihoeflea sp. 40Bstr573 TaxID=2696467 RepID=UPI002095D3B0|nr:DnaJ family molecular chaperone [Aliihoeflea sp. 40Bstr573]MCO6388053.1 DnaJ domain-containing protein [Aliihoeflea sp. 40Bstr573]
MSIWFRLGDFVSRVSSNALVSLADAIRSLVTTDPELRRRVSFSIAMIALSAKMAKADGVVSAREVNAFQEIFEIPEEEARNVARLYDLAKQDVAGFDAYARQMAGLCGSGQPNCAMLEDILDGLFHIAKADGYIHERELAFLAAVAEIFEIDEPHFERILARHTFGADSDPYLVLGLAPDLPFEEVRRAYRKLVAENHPDRLIGRGVPEEFVAIATARLAAINAAFEMIERQRMHA